MKNYLKFIFLGLVFVLFMTAGYFFYLLKKPVASPQNLSLATTIPTPVTQAQIFKGSIACLPLANGIFEDPKECAIGLKAESSGKYYALFGLKGTDVPPGSIGMKVEVSGSLRKDFPGVDFSVNYKVDGGIDVIYIKKI